MGEGPGGRRPLRSPLDASLWRRQGKVNTLQPQFSGQGGACWPKAN